MAMPIAHELPTASEAARAKANAVRARISQYGRMALAQAHSAAALHPLI